MKIYQTTENGIHIIEYEERFAASLADMWNQSRDNWGGGSDLETEQRQIDLYRSGSYYNVYLAVDGEEVVGLCSLSRYYKDADALYVHVLNVRPDYLSKKLGKAMILECYKRTIELGYPRLEIHTWPGNTKAMPLYKKCGFMWEDNSETTHLTNFIPTIIAQELLKPYFEKTDWYKDSTRSLDIVPDSKVSDGFDFFTYSWVSNGENLAVTIEKFGRRISKVETDDYIIELTAKNHFLAYGFSYPAEVIVTNKSGKQLDVSVIGKTDGIITFNPENKSFSIDKPLTKQDPYRKHPCVLADVTVNGKNIELGVGIEAKSPIIAALDSERGLSTIGQKFDAFITLESILPIGTKVNFTLPENEYVRFASTVYNVEVNDLGKISLQTSAEVLKIGHVKLDVPCDINLPDGQKTSFNMPLDIINYGLTERFSCMTEKMYGIVNGLFILETYKTSNYTVVKHSLLNIDDDSFPPQFPQFPVSKLGKPYDDEFNLAVPSEIKAYESGSDMVMELSFVSEKQSGVTMTMVYALSASGVITRKHRIENSGKSRTLYLSETCDTSVYKSCAYHYDGRIVMSQDATDDGFDSADSALFKENWVFKNDSDYSVGVCWEPNLNATFRWSDGITLEQVLELAPEDVRETPPVTVCIGMFKDFTAFRNYVKNTYSDYHDFSEDLLEISVNNYNSFVYENDVAVSIRNNRNKVYTGKIELAPVLDCADCFESQSKDFPDEDDDAKALDFTLSLNKDKINNGIAKINVNISAVTNISKKERVIFTPYGNVECVEKDGIYNVSNGIISYKSDPRYYAGLYSLHDKTGSEWLMSNYPNHEPRAWWNPFIGGMQNWHEKMNAANTLKEKRSAEFASINDNFGNNWQGVKARVDVTINKDYKGLSYDNYYLTLPGVPVLCSFTRYINNTGGYLITAADESFYYNFSKDDEKTAEITRNGNVLRFKIGTSAIDSDGVKFAKIANSAGENLYWLPNLRDKRFVNFASDDNNSFFCVRNFYVNVKNGGEMLTSPVFQVICKENLTTESLTALQRISFT